MTLPTLQLKPLAPAGQHPSRSCSTTHSWSSTTTRARVSSVRSACGRVPGDVRTLRRRAGAHPGARTWCMTYLQRGEHATAHCADLLGRLVRRRALQLLRHRPRCVAPAVPHARNIHTHHSAWDGSERRPNQCVRIGSGSAPARGLGSDGSSIGPAPWKTASAPHRLNIRDVERVARHLAVLRRTDDGGDVVRRVQGGGHLGFWWQKRL
jgi:hypothetical protein